VAVGAPVLLTSNCYTASNSETGVVVRVHDTDGFVDKLSIKIDGTGKLVTIGRTLKQSITYNETTYVKSTFPLQLAYAMTAHKAQSVTISRPVILDVAGVFEAGELYVLFSRVTKASLLTICGRLTPTMFRPIRINGLNA